MAVNMSGMVPLDQLLKNLTPVLSTREFVFCTIKNGKYGDYHELDPLFSFSEEEGLTLVLEKETAEKKGLAYGTVFKKVTLQVHSSLDAVGLTAAVSSALADKGISANVVAAFYHDHVFVPSGRSEEAFQIVLSLSAS